MKKQFTPEDHISEIHVDGRIDNARFSVSSAMGEIECAMHDATYVQQILLSALLVDARKLFNDLDRFYGALHDDR